MSDGSDRFVAESREALTALGDGLVALERDEGDVDELFRVAHTLKGNCGAAGYEDAAAVAHALEDLLGAVRRGDLEASPGTVDDAMAAVEALEVLTETVAAGEDPTGSVDRESVESAVHERLRDAGLTPTETDERSPDGESAMSGDAESESESESTSSDDVEPTPDSGDPVPDVDDLAPPDPGDDLSAEEALERASVFDDLEGLTEQMDDAEEFEDVEGVGSFDDLTDDGDGDGDGDREEETDPLPDLGAGADDGAGDGDAGTIDPPASTEPGDEDDDFAVIREEVDRTDPGTLQSELEEVEFGEFDDEDTMDIQELMSLDPADETDGPATDRTSSPAGTADGAESAEPATTDPDTPASDTAADATQSGPSTPDAPTAEPANATAATDDDAEATVGVTGTTGGEPSPDVGATGATGGDSVVAAIRSLSTDEPSSDAATETATDDGRSTVASLVQSVDVEDDETTAQTDDPGTAEAEVTTAGTDEEPSVEAETGEPASAPEADGETPAETGTEQQTSAAEPDEEPASEDSTETTPEPATDAEPAETADADTAAEGVSDDSDTEGSFDFDALDDSATGVDSEPGPGPERAETTASPDADPDAATVEPSDDGDEQPEPSTPTPADAADEVGASEEESPSTSSTGEETAADATPPEEPALADVDAPTVADLADEPDPEAEPELPDEVDVDLGDGPATGATGDLDAAVDVDLGGDLDADLSEAPGDEGLAFESGSETTGLTERFGEEFGTGPRPVEDEDLETDAAATIEAALGESEPVRDSGATAGTISVDTEDADDLLAATEQLITASNEIDRVYEGEDRGMTDALAELREAVSDLEDSVTSVRLVPLERALGGLRRVVRNAARESDREKRVDLSVAGGDVELDRAIVDAVDDPLVHAVRNAVDHGIEPVEEREAAGKPPEGTVEVSAERLGDEVRIEISDDGRGIHPDEVRQRAAERGVVEEAVAAQMSDAEARELVFEPGFSTTEEVTDVSGRGVGMDVVRRVAREYGGEATIDSSIGEGTTVRLTLPVSVAVTETLLVRVGDEQYAVPAEGIERVEAFDSGAVSDGEYVFERREPVAEAAVAGGGAVEETVEVETETQSERCPVVDLGDVLSVRRAPGAARSGGVVVRIRDEVRPLAIRCDDIGEWRTVVVSPYEDVFGDVPGIDGATVLGDGEVVNVLDPRTLPAGGESR